MNEYRFLLCYHDGEITEINKYFSTDEESSSYARYLLEKYKCKEVTIKLAMTKWIKIGNVK